MRRQALLLGRATEKVKREADEGFVGSGASISKHRQSRDVFSKVCCARVGAPGIAVHQTMRECLESSSCACLLCEHVSGAVHTAPRESVKMALLPRLQLVLLTWVWFRFPAGLNASRVV